MSEEVRIEMKPIKVPYRKDSDGTIDTKAGQAFEVSTDMGRGPEHLASPGYVTLRLNRDDGTNNFLASEAAELVEALLKAISHLRDHGRLT